MNDRGRSISRFWQTAALALAIAVFASAPLYAQPQDAPKVVVAAKTSLVHLRPSAEAEVVVSADKNAEFTVTGSTEGWVKVAVGTKGEGWLPKVEVGLKVEHDGNVCVELELSDALKLGSVQGGFHGTGASTGDSVEFEGKGTLSLDLCPEIRPGTVLHNANGGGQDMVIRKLEGIPEGNQIVLVPRLRFEPSVEAKYVFEAYCVNFHKENPGSSDVLSPAGNANTAVLQILKVDNGDDDTGLQLAIWAATDNLTPAEARQKFNATPDDIAHARQIVQAAGLAAASYRLFGGR